MFVDASALVAMIFGEPDAAGLAMALASANEGERHTSPIAIFETVAAICRGRKCSIATARELVADFLEETSIQIAPVTQQHGELALTALDRFGEGRHPAALNMGDCFAYAATRALKTSILFKGDDFSRTDLVSAMVL